MIVDAVRASLGVVVAPEADDNDDDGDDDDDDKAKVKKRYDDNDDDDDNAVDDDGFGAVDKKAKDRTGYELNIDIDIEEITVEHESNIINSDDIDSAEKSDERWLYVARSARERRQRVADVSVWRRLLPQERTPSQVVSSSAKVNQ
jgi:hypothetical protein